MKSDPDKLLNQLVVAALTVFIVVIMLLAALVLRQIWLQQQIANLSSEVQVSLNDLEEITEDIQRELSEAPSAVNLGDITETLDEVDEQLTSIGEGLTEVALALEPQVDTTLALAGDDGQINMIQDQVDHVFTIFTVLVAVAGIVIAILLGMAMRVQQTGSYDV